MTTQEFIEKEFANDNGKTRYFGSILKDDHGNLYSYGRHYPLLFKVGNQTFRNVRGWSVSTGRHIRWCDGISAIDVELDNDATEIVNRSYKSDQEKLEHIFRCLSRQKANLFAELDSKKRKDTFVYRNLKQQLNFVSKQLAQVF